MTQLGRALPYHFRSWHRSILSGRFRRACKASLECKQSKEVLLLINVSMINMLVCYIRTMYFLLFRSYKCLNLNSIMPEVLRPDDLGQLTLICNSYKCLNLNSIMPQVLEPDDLGQLTLIRSYHKCLTLIRSSHKCLNLNSIMPEVLKPDDLGQLTLVLSFFKYLNLSLSILFKVPIRVGYIYCYLVSIKDAYSVH